MADDGRVSDRRPPFERALRRLIKRPDFATAAILDHLAGQSGGFDRLSRQTDPMQLTPVDVLAAGLLGRPLTTQNIEWLISDEGQWLVAEVLADIAPDSHIGDSDTRAIIRAGDLFRLLRSRKSTGMTRSVATRLLATKRPALVPIDDSVARRFLGYAKSDEWWVDWRDALSAEVLDRVTEARSAAVERAPEAADLSDLRVLDIALRARLTSAQD